MVPVVTGQRLAQSVVADVHPYIELLKYFLYFSRFYIVGSAMYLCWSRRGLFFGVVWKIYKFICCILLFLELYVYLVQQLLAHKAYLHDCYLAAHHFWFPPIRIVINDDFPEMRPVRRWKRTRMLAFLAFTVFFFFYSFLLSYRFMRCVRRSIYQGFDDLDSAAIALFKLVSQLNGNNGEATNGDDFDNGNPEKARHMHRLRKEAKNNQQKGGKKRGGNNFGPKRDLNPNERARANDRHDRDEIYAAGGGQRHVPQPRKKEHVEADRNYGLNGIDGDGSADGFQHPKENRKARREREREELSLATSETSSHDGDTVSAVTYDGGEHPFEHEEFMEEFVPPPVIERIYVRQSTGEANELRFLIILIQILLSMMRWRYEWLGRFLNACFFHRDEYDEFLGHFRHGCNVLLTSTRQFVEMKINFDHTNFEGINTVFPSHHDNIKLQMVVDEDPFTTGVITSVDVFRDKGFHFFYEALVCPVMLSKLRVAHSGSKPTTHLYTNMMHFLKATDSKLAGDTCAFFVNECMYHSYIAAKVGEATVVMAK